MNKNKLGVQGGFGRLKTLESLSGIMFLMLGGIFLYAAKDYPIGEMRRIGAGFFPVVLSSMLVLLGAVSLLKSLFRSKPDDEKMSNLAILPLVLIVTSIITFAVTLPRLGLIVSVILTVAIASLASRETKLREVPAIAICTLVITYVIFVLLVRLPIKVWPI